MLQPLPDHDHLLPWLNHEGRPDLGKDHKDLEQILDAASGLRVPEGQSKAEAWQMLEGRLADRQPALSRRMPMRRILMAAASILLLLSAGIWWTQRSQVTTYASARAEHRTLDLPDGSSVFLNAESQVSFDKSHWEEDRTIYLKGEGFFQVKKGPLFRVITDQGTISVLGTSFNVYAREEKLEVACYTGEVKVDNASGLTKNLTPGKALVHEPASPEKTRLFEVEKQKIGSWQKGKFYFDNESLIDVIAVLERQYDVTVLFPGLENIRYSGWFSNQNLELALKTICSPLDIQYQFKQKSHILLQQAVKVDAEK